MSIPRSQPEISTRAYTEADLPWLCGLPQSAHELLHFFPDAIWPLQERVMHERNLGRHSPTVLLYQGKPAGFANLYDVANGSSAYIGNLIIDPAFRGKGLATTLMETMKDIAAKKYHIKDIKLVVLSDNVAAMRLYHGINYKPFEVEFRHHHDGTPIALVHMHKSVHL